VDDGVGAPESAFNDMAVADIALYQFHLRIEFGGSFALPVNLFDQAVQNADLVAAGQEFAADCAPDESGSAGDDYLLHSLSPQMNANGSRRRADRFMQEIQMMAAGTSSSTA
jgi:hypothetical protein